MLIVGKGKTIQECRKVNSAKVKDIRWDLIHEEIMKELKPYEEYIKKSLYLEEHLKRKYPTEKKYLESFKQFSTYAVLTPKGEWYEAGSMGWWGISSATPEQEAKFKKIIKKISLKQQIQNGN